ncbi:uncharacterized protein LOC110844622 isoform X1 [Folsomia candida]|uniref:uncharacterized protein LOC110844622 isoform X1 n=1 Tax=Folsomia candida TaxID=158441 RepID=UPI0016054102|nr:uncharacterized protein LOC110844622 isoform X1 [Folsomia candida]
MSGCVIVGKIIDSFGTKKRVVSAFSEYRKSQSEYEVRHFECLVVSEWKDLSERCSGPSLQLFFLIKKMYRNASLQNCVISGHGAEVWQGPSQMTIWTTPFHYESFTNSGRSSLVCTTETLHSSDHFNPRSCHTVERESEQVPTYESVVTVNTEIVHMGHDGSLPTYKEYLNMGYER